MNTLHLIAAIVLLSMTTRVLAAQGQTLVLERRILHDPTTNLDVGTLLVPRGWTLDQQILWRLDRGCFVGNTSTITDPQSGLAIRWLPLDQFNAAPALAANARQQGVAPISGGLELCDQVATPDQFVTQIVIPRYRRQNNLKIIAATDLMPLARSIKQERAVEVAAAQRAGYTLMFGAAKVRIEYTAANNVVMEEDIYLVLNLTWNEQANASARAMGFAAGQSQLFFPERLYSFAAPKGRLDAATPLLQSIAGSLRPTVRWDAYVARLNQIRQQGVIDRGAMDAAAREAINAQQHETWKQHMASEDRIAEGVGDVLRGVQRFTEPTDPSRQVMLPAGYPQAWSNGQDLYIISDDVNFNPNQQPGIQGNWQHMQQKK